jgi:hypothetical protein
MVATDETLLSPSAVKLYGRVIDGLKVDLTGAGNPLGANSFLRKQLKADDACFARIYGFSFEGFYRPLSRPAIFLVHGPGDNASPPAAQVKQGTTSKGAITIVPNDAFLDPATTPVDSSGVAAKEWEFSTDIKVWEYDQADFSLRFEVSSGPLDRILIDREEAGDEMPYFRGSKTRLRGSD